jgi:uncharacterized protein (TIGR02646 family)
MRKIEKDLTDIPKSLVVAKNTTHDRRKELIAKGEYIDISRFNSRYKTRDIKDKLNSLYHHKCAYCEDHAEQTHVDHYRPKQIYYWLAYSWDNLICSCPTCNQFKTNDFAINGKKAVPPKTTDDLSDINTWSSQKYDRQEKPMLLNPERDVLNNVFLFDMEGHIKGNDNSRADYTIKTCHLDRDELVDERRKIVDDYRKAVEAELLNASTADEQRRSIEVLTRDFQRKAKDRTNTFYAYRNVALGWLDDIVKEIVEVSKDK